MPLAISSCFLPSGRQIFTAVVMARCIIPEHSPSLFWIKAGVSSVIPFQQACVLPLILLKVGNSTVTHCCHCLCSGKRFAVWLNCSNLLCLSLGPKKRKKKKIRQMQVTRGKRKGDFQRGSVQTNFLEKSALCARSLNCEASKGHGHNPAVEELLSCGSIEPGCRQRKLWVLLQAGVKLKAKGQGCFTTLKRNKWRGIWMQKNLVFMKPSGWKSN